MNIAVGFACLVVVAVLDGITGLSERQISNENQNGVNYGSNLPYVNEERPAGNPPRSRICRLGLGGKCIKKRKPCPSHLPLEKTNGKPYCNKKRRRCCYPAKDTCASNNGTQFIYAGVSYCLSMEFAIWKVSRDWCEDMGMSMAEPADPIGLATYINSLEHYCWFWLGGLGDGWNQFWLNGTVISNTSLLWEPGQPNVTVDDCLALQTCLNPSTPLTTFNCSEYSGFRLCQDNTRISMETIRDEPYSDEWNIDDELDSDADVENDNIREDTVRDNKKGNESDEDEADEDE